MSNPSGERRGGKVIKEYIYRDEHGAPFHKVERTEDKQFPQSHWVNGIDGFKKGHWKFGAPADNRYPYCVTELVKAPKDTLVVSFEGEKDHETGMDLDLLATTNAGSLNGFTKWCRKLLPWYKGFQCLAVVGDCDKIGRHFARVRAQAFSRIIPDVRIVELPDLEEGGDFSDWVAAGGTKEKFLELWEALPKFVPAPLGNKLDEIIKFGAGIYFDTDAKAVWFIINEMLRRGYQPSQIKMS